MDLCIAGGRPAAGRPLDPSDTGPSVVMGFQEEQVREALEKVGTEGTYAVVRYLLDYGRA